MKKILFVLLSALAIMSLGSCDYREDVEKLIHAKKYNEARDLLYEHFDEFGTSGTTRYLNKIAKAELEDLYADKDYSEVAALKNELKSPIQYQLLFADNLKGVLTRGNYDFIFETLQEWQIFAEPRLEFDNWPHNEHYFLEEPKVYNIEFEKNMATSGRHPSADPGEYNAEAKYYNHLLDQTIEKLLDENDIDNIRRFIKLYKPYAILKSKSKLPSNNYSKREGDYEHHYVYELVDTSAKDEAIKKIAAAGLQL